MNPNTAFVSLTLFSMLRFPLNFLPNIIQGFIQFNVSTKRIKEFLLRDEIDDNDISHIQNEGNKNEFIYSLYLSFFHCTKYINLCWFLFFCM